jgi:beta-carotene 3-hydroxylase
VIDALLVGVVAFVAMEPVTYAAHRWVMHGIGWVWHSSHHRRRPGAAPSAGGQRFEANDWFPVVFAGITILLMAAGSATHPLAWLIPMGVGVTAYGAAYAFVHDLYIHGRFVRLPVIRPFEYLREAHALHHRFGREPYGMLCPIVPKALRERAARPAPARADSALSLP